MDREQLRAALERTLREIDADEHLGPLIGSTRLRMRFEFTDLEMALNVAAGEGDRNLTWSFADEPGWAPKLTLRMTSEVANRYLQGRESADRAALPAGRQAVLRAVPACGGNRVPGARGVIEAPV